MMQRFAAPICAAFPLVLCLCTGVALADPGHGNGAGQPAATSSAPSADNSTGVKPSSTTAHNTSAPAWSNQTKRYGNGKTAGQIATQAGFGAAILHGPGNSQPHKTSCGAHEVDVHALKANSKKCGAVVQAKVEAVHVAAVHVAAPASLHAAVRRVGAAVVATAATAVAPAPAASAPAVSAPAAAPARVASAPSTPAAAGVKAAKVAFTAPKRSAREVAGAAAAPKPVSGVLGTAKTLASAIAGARLPFTGLSLWIFVLAAAALGAAGALVHRSACARA